MGIWKLNLEMIGWEIMFMWMLHGNMKSKSGNVSMIIMFM
jgi:hypothetical protein